MDNKDSVEITAGLSVAAITLFVFFGAYLRKVLDAAGAGDGPLPLIAFAGTVVFGVGIAIDNTILFALAEAADDIDPTAVQALQALWDNDFLPILFGMVLLLIGAGLSVVRFGGLPKWLGWAAIVLAVLAPTPIGVRGLPRRGALGPDREHPAGRAGPWGERAARRSAHARIACRRLVRSHTSSAGPVADRVAGSAPILFRAR